MKHLTDEVAVMILHCFGFTQQILLQVYMVAMQQEKEKQNNIKSAAEDDDEDDDFGDNVTGESLLSLVQPEMVTLSKHWLAALKDHALLSLPTGMKFL